MKLVRTNGIFRNRYLALIGLALSLLTVTACSKATFRRQRLECRRRWSL